MLLKIKWLTTLIPIYALQYVLLNDTIKYNNMTKPQWRELANKWLYS